MAQFVEHLSTWQRSHSLISAAENGRIWDRHIADSIQLVSLAPSAKRWLDIGSGNGFPAIVIASAIVDIPDALVHCVESDTRKCAFLADIARKLSLPIAIHPKRVEMVHPQSLMPIDAVTARAFASVPKLLRLAQPYISAGAVGIFPIGRKLEVQHQIPSYCKVDYCASSTHANSTILLAHRNKSAEQCS